MTQKDPQLTKVLILLDEKVVAQIKTHCLAKGLKIQRYMGRVVEENWKETN